MRKKIKISSLNKRIILKNNERVYNVCTDNFEICKDRSIKEVAELESDMSNIQVSAIDVQDCEHQSSYKREVWASIRKSNKLTTDDVSIEGVQYFIIIKLCRDISHDTRVIHENIPLKIISINYDYAPGFMQILAEEYMYAQ